MMPTQAQLKRPQVVVVGPSSYCAVDFPTFLIQILNSVQYGLLLFMLCFGAVTIERHGTPEQRTEYLNTRPGHPGRQRRSCARRRRMAPPPHLAARQPGT